MTSSGRTPIMATLILIPLMATLTGMQGKLPEPLPKHGIDASKPVRNASGAYRATRGIIGSLPYEAVAVLYTDAKGRILDSHVTTREIGTDLYTPWELWMNRLPKGTTALYYVHNHPREVPVRLGWAEGNPKDPGYQPSIDYLQLTGADIRYADHWAAKAHGLGVEWDTLAINRFGYVSYREEGFSPDQVGGNPLTDLLDLALYRVGFPAAQGATWLSNGLFGPGATSKTIDILYDAGTSMSS